VVKRIAGIVAVLLLLPMGEGVLRAQDPRPAIFGRVPRAVEGLVRAWELPVSDVRHVSERRWTIEHPDPLAAARAALQRLRAEPTSIAGIEYEAKEARLWSQLFSVPLDDDPIAFGLWRGGNDASAAADALASRLEKIESAAVEAWARPGPDGASIRVVVWTLATSDDAAEGATLAEAAIDEMSATLAWSSRRVLDEAIDAAAAPLEEALIDALLDPYADPTEAPELVASLGALAASRGTVRLGRVEAGEAAHLVATDLMIGDRRTVRVRAQMRAGRIIVTIDAEGGEGLESDVVAILRALGEE